MPSERLSGDCQFHMVSSMHTRKVTYESGSKIAHVKVTIVGVANVRQ